MLFMDSKVTDFPHVFGDSFLLLLTQTVYFICAQRCNEIFALYDYDCSTSVIELSKTMEGAERMTTTPSPFQGTE